MSPSLASQEDADLARLVAPYANTEMTSKDWGRVGEQIGKTAKQCRERWCNVLDPRLTLLRAKWTDEELERLFEAVRVHGSRWSYFSETMFPGRCVPTCVPSSAKFSSGASLSRSALSVILPLFKVYGRLAPAFVVFRPIFHPFEQSFSQQPFAVLFEPSLL